MTMDKAQPKAQTSLHLISDQDETGKFAYYFIEVSEDKLEEFLKIANNKRPVNLTSYGKIVFSAYGDPTPQVRQWMREQYGWQE